MFFSLAEVLVSAKRGRLSLTLSAFERALKILFLYIHSFIHVVKFELTRSVQQ